VGALLTLTPYRISINPNLLTSSVDELLAHSGSPQALAEFLNWSSPPEILSAGFPPQKDARKLLLMMKENKLRKQLKAKRSAKGYRDFIQPRKSFKGWWQRKFNDPKEISLACGYQILNFLKNSPRLSLLAYVSAANRLVAKALSVPPAKVSPAFIIENLYGHVFKYDQKHSFAHYFA
jgi:hypothetical protein